MKKWHFAWFFFLISLSIRGQSDLPTGFFVPSDTLNPTRFWICTGGGAALYSGASIGLYHAWYKGFELTRFHLFNDWREWRGMDKAGHLFTTHMESNLAFRGALWTGMNRKTAAWTGFGVGMLLQSTIEFMDGFSAKWGFSLHDMGFNLLGGGLFLSQELLWQEQRFLVKTSYMEPNYSQEPIFASEGSGITTLAERARDLYGVSYPERFLKGYNGLTIWLSANPTSFQKSKNSRWPVWLNIAVGYGAENLYGGFENRWETEGSIFESDDRLYPRFSQYYLSLDVDFSRIPTRKPWLKTIFHTINWLKIPAPAIEFQSRGKFRLHPLMW